MAANSGRIAICLAGGSSPKALYQLLAAEAYRSKIPWDRVDWFIGDERFVPPTDPAQQHGHGAADLARPVRTGRQHPSDSDGFRRLPTKAQTNMHGSCSHSMARTSWTLPARCSMSC